MLILHLADLHLGKLLFTRSLYEDQFCLIEQILDAVKTRQPKAVLISGDVYDRVNPSKEAMKLFSALLTGLSELDTEILVIAGNHDGAEKLEYVSEILAKNRIHVAGITSDRLQQVTIPDEYGDVRFFLMPFTFPTAVKDALALENDAFSTYSDAVKTLLGAQTIDPDMRNVLLSHQTVTYGGADPEFGGSETAVGGVGGVDREAYEIFDYVALGHIHRQQRISDRIYYAGTPMCYHFDEIGRARRDVEGNIFTLQDKKGGLFVTLGEKGTEPVIEPLILEPLHPLREVRGTYEEVVEALRKTAERGMYYRAVLSGYAESADEIAAIRSIIESHGSYLLDASRVIGSSDGGADVSYVSSAENLSVEELFVNFCEKVGREGLTEEEFSIIERTADSVRSLPDGDVGTNELTEARTRAAQALAEFILNLEE